MRCAPGAPACASSSSIRTRSIAGSAKSRISTSPLPQRVVALGLPQQPARLFRACNKMASSTPSRSCARATARSASACSSAPAPRACSTPSLRIARAIRTTQALPDWFDHRYTQNIFSIADFVAQRARLSAGRRLRSRRPAHRARKSLLSARRAIAAGTCDAAIVGGVDSLCLTTLYGFNSLQLVSGDICRPADAARGGISIGEAAGFALLDPHADAPIALARLRRDERCVSHVFARSGRPGRRRIDARRAGVREARRRLRSTTSICMAPARWRTTTPKAARSAPCSATTRLAARRKAGPATRSAPPASSKPRSPCCVSNMASCRAV